MMYSKAMLMGDKDVAQRVLACGKPANAKKLGQSVKPWNEKVGAVRSAGGFVCPSC